MLPIISIVIIIIIIIMSMKSTLKGNEVLMALNQPGKPGLGWTALKLEFVSG